MYYGADHPMKPPRIAMAHSLIVGYGLHEKMDVYVSFRVENCSQDINVCDSLEAPGASESHFCY